MDRQPTVAVPLTPRRETPGITFTLARPLTKVPRRTSGSGKADEPREPVTR
jgi:hypothetical protein